MKKIAIISALLVVACSLAPLSVLAVDGSDHTSTDEGRTTTLKNAEDTRKTVTKERETKLTEVKRERLGAEKLKICEKRQTQVNTIMDRVVSRSTNSFERITTASERAQAFYLKQGNLLTNYDALVATVASTKVTAQAAIDMLSSSSTFTCTSDAPKSDIQDFKTHRTHKIESLSAYRDAVKALIKGIKSVQPVETATSEVNR